MRSVVFRSFVAIFDEEECIIDRHTHDIDTTTYSHACKQAVKVE